MEITKQSVIGDVLDFAPETAEFFFEIGMHCLGCPMSRGEMYGAALASCEGWNGCEMLFGSLLKHTDADELDKKLNAAVANKK